jgi:S-disulfanyl-L-cysteine oxidoreductase SoxD
MLTGINSYAGDLPKGPRLGEPVDEVEIAKWEIGVMPDGTGLPPGKGNVADGEKIYKQHCQVCHGEGAVGDSGEQLAGARMSLTSEWPEKTVGSYWPYATTLYDFIRRSMPMTSPGILTDNEVYAVSAYILYLNGIISNSDIMTAKTLREIRMPNHDRFINIYHTGGMHD